MLISVLTFIFQMSQSFICLVFGLFVVFQLLMPLNGFPVIGKHSKKRLEIAPESLKVNQPDSEEMGTRVYNSAMFEHWVPKKTELKRKGMLILFIDFTCGLIELHFSIFVYFATQRVRQFGVTIVTNQYKLRLQYKLRSNKYCYH